MNLKIGEKIHLMDVDENTQTYTFPYIYEVFILWDMNLVFLQYYQNTIIFRIMDTSQHFCYVFVAYYIFAISNFH